MADALSITRSTLYRAFSSDGVASYIQGRRLEAIRTLLRSPDETRSLMALAADFGFASHAHLSAVFRRRFGCAPSSVRRPRAGDAAEDASVEVFQSWQRDLDAASHGRRRSVE